VADLQDELAHLRSLLESVALLETVAARREGRIEEILGFLRSHGMTVEDLAGKLGVSLQSIRALLGRDEPKPPHERIGISQKSVSELTLPATDDL
jgi:hypothetical protein